MEITEEIRNGNDMHHEIRDEMRNRFMQSKDEQDKKQNSTSLSDVKYANIVREVINVKGKTKLLPNEYRLVKRYDVLNVRGIQKLIFPVTDSGDVKYFVKDSEVFDILNESHVALGHKGRDAMEKHIKRKYKNITQAEISLFLSFCKGCQEKKKMKKKGVVVRPLIFEELNSRCQVDLIDYQTCPSGTYKWLLNYQDHLTKFVVLKPLKSKTSEEVAYNLLDIFTLIGAPSILQSDNGKEFVNKIIENLKLMWPELQIVHGKPRHSQSQGSVERANQDVENKYVNDMDGR